MSFCTPLEGAETASADRSRNDIEQMPGLARHEVAG